MRIHEFISPRNEEIEIQRGQGWFNQFSNLVSFESNLLPFPLTEFVNKYL